MLKDPKNNRRKIVRRKPGSKPTEDYFSKETQAAILEYQLETDIATKQDIYVKRILPAFDSLVENLINVYGYKVMYETKKDLKSECMEFLFTTVGKFNGNLGSKAFSYFNVVARNWLTIKSKQNAKKLKTYISTDDKESFTNSDIEQLEKFNIVKSVEDKMIEQESSQNHRKIILAIAKKTKTENEKICLDGIMEIAENLDNLEILNKRAVLCYLRHITNLSPKQLSVVLSNVKKYYKEVRKDLENE